MSIQELKTKIHKLVDESSSEEELNYMYKLMTGNEEEGDFWLNLSEEEKIEIEKGLEDIRMGRVVSHEEAMKRIAKWR